MTDKRSSIVAAIGLVLIAGCARSTGILPAGPDTYTITERFSPILGGGDQAEKDAITKANAFCTDKGRQFVPSLMDQSGLPADRNGPSGYSVTFKCLLPGDPALAGYQLQQAPDVVIEHRNR